MDNKHYYAYNQTKECFLSGALTLVDAGREPLKVLKILIEGLAPNAKSGLWLIHFRNVPVARTLSPFDLIYLDSEHRVVHAVELSTDGEFAPFTGQPASALVLPAHSISSSKTRAGHQLIIRAAAETDHQSATDAAPAEVAQIPASQVQPPAEEGAASPLERFLARQSTIAVGQGRIQQSTKSLLELSPTTHPTLSNTPTPGVQGASAVGDFPNPSRPVARAMPVPAPRSLEPRVASAPAPHAGSAPSPSEPSSGPQTTARIAQPSRSKIQQFPSRTGIPSGPDAHRNPAEALPQLPGLDEEIAPPFQELPSLEPPSQDNVSLLMRILRLRFLKRERKARQNLPIQRAVEVDETVPASKAVPMRVLRVLRWLYPEFEILNEPPIALTKSYTSKTKFQSEPKPTLDMQFVKWLYPELNFRRATEGSAASDRRLASRLQKPGLVAYYFTGGPPRAHRLGDISVTGFYMHTDERWMPGTIIRMTLQLGDTRGEDPTDTITVHSRVVRWGPDGEGFEFVLAGFLDEPLPISYRRSERTRQ